MVLEKIIFKRYFGFQFFNLKMETTTVLFLLKFPPITRQYSEKDTEHTLEWHEHRDPPNESNELYQHQAKSN